MMHKATELATVFGHMLAMRQREIQTTVNKFQQYDCQFSISHSNSEIENLPNQLCTGC
jgi:hypothetical protein